RASLRPIRSSGQVGCPRSYRPAFVIPKDGRSRSPALPRSLNAVLLVDENGVLLAGHGTLQAARHLGFEEVPVIVIAHLSELQKRAYMIADNQLALNSEWDEEKLGRELAELEQQLVDLKVVGFSP